MRVSESVRRTLLAVALMGVGLESASAQTGSIQEPVRIVGDFTINPDVHDGGLRPPIGVASHQTLRVNRTHPEQADGFGWTYNHASNLAYWNGTFYQQYLSNPVDEHIPPGHTLMVTSKNGRDWSPPEVVFPAYEPPPGVEIPKGFSGYMMHQRMGFHVTPNDRLLVLAFYGHSEDPFAEGGIGRVVREAYRDGTYGPIYFIRYSSHTDWNETNTSFPFYKTSDDPGFVEACENLLANKLITLQWWDEDQGLDGYYQIKEAGSAFSFYRRKDDVIVGLWKRSRFALSTDGGLTFSNLVKAPTFIMAGGKQWGQATEDGRYAILYNPIEMDEHRYPLIVVSSDDGIVYDDMLVVQGEVPPRRFVGRWKDYGPCYVRGIIEGNGNPPGEDLWVTYSMNKEDMWVSRVPLPIRSRWEGPAADDFDDLETGGEVPDWNLYDPLWAPVGVVEHPSRTDKSLRLEDKDPYDYALATRVFEEGKRVDIRFAVSADQTGQGRLDIDVTDRFGGRPIRLTFDSDGSIKAQKGGEVTALRSYSPGEWVEVALSIDATPYGGFDLSIDGEKVLEDADLAVAVKSVERLVFRTGPYRDLPNRRTDNEAPHPPLPGADEPEPTAAFHVDKVRITSR